MLSHWLPKAREFSWSSDHIAGQAWLQRGLRREVEGRVETREGKEEEERERE